MATYQQMRLHEYCKMLPPMTDEEMKSLEESVLQVGILDPIVVYKGDDGIEEILDGRHREKVYAKLIRSGKTETAEGKPLELPKTYFDGDELECLAFVMAKGVNRRHLTSSQKAAVAVLGDQVEAKMRKKRLDQDRKAGKELPPEPEEAKEVSELEIAQALADKSGTNRDYICSCRTIAKKAPAVLKDIVAGRIKISEGKAAVRRIEAGLPAYPKPEEDDDDGSDEKPESPAKPAPAVILKNGLGGEVPAELNDIFATVSQFKQLAKEVRALKPNIEALGDTAGGSWLDVREVKGDANNMARAIMDAAPYVPCPHCKHTGHEAGGAKAPCISCKGSKFLTKDRKSVV